MLNKSLSVIAIGAFATVAFVAGRGGIDVLGGGTAVAAEKGTLTALDYQEITQLINRYAYGIDTCAGNGYDYANVFTTRRAVHRQQLGLRLRGRRPRAREGPGCARRARRRRLERL